MIRERSARAFCVASAEVTAASPQAPEPGGERTLEEIQREHLNDSYWGVV